MPAFITENLIIINLKQIKTLEKGKEYEYVEAGLGREEDFMKLDLTGNWPSFSVEL